MLRRLVRPVLLTFAVLAVVICAFAVAISNQSEAVEFQSAALGESRKLVIYNLPADRRARPENVIYALDGERWRHGLATAMNASLLAALRGREAPVVVAIDGKGRRETDLRNGTSDPAEWRPFVSGRADRFDRFLLDELRPFVAHRLGQPAHEHLFGHSLGGLYVLDLATRGSSADGFDSYAAFSPTFSHDRSILDRLQRICGKSVLATIGLESNREDRLFASAQRAVKCPADTVRFRRHPGMIHQVVMLTGQVDAVDALLGAPVGS